jgi:hypothetical protein
LTTVSGQGRPAAVGFYPASRAIQEAVQEKLDRLKQSHLAEECAKLDPAFEKAMAEEGMSEERGAWRR